MVICEADQPGDGGKSSPRRNRARKSAKKARPSLSAIMAVKASCSLSPPGDGSGACARSPWRPVDLRHEIGHQHDPSACWIPEVKLRSQSTSSRAHARLLARSQIRGDPRATGLCTGSADPTQCDGRFPSSPLNGPQHPGRDRSARDRRPQRRLPDRPRYLPAFRGGLRYSRGLFWFSVMAWSCRKRASFSAASISRA